MAQQSPKSKKILEKQLIRRNNLWPRSEYITWDRKKRKGYVSVPRIIPYVMVLFQELGLKNSPNRVYLELWIRSNDAGFVEIKDESEHAYASGYVNRRAVRSWQERIYLLQDLGFIRIKPRGIKPIGFVLLIDPYRAVINLSNELQYKDQIPDNWLNAFNARAQEVGEDLDDLIKDIDVGF